MTTARTATVSVAANAWTKLYAKVMSWIIGVYKFMHGPYLERPQPSSTTVVIEICTACGQPAVNDL